MAYTRARALSQLNEKLAETTSEDALLAFEGQVEGLFATTREPTNQVNSEVKSKGGT